MKLNKWLTSTKFIVSLYIGVIILLIFFLYKIVVYENFEDTIVVSNLDSSAGFYSMFFFTLNHYIYCKRNKIGFRIKSDNWLFKSSIGWTDYFEPVELTFHNNPTNEQSALHSTVLGDYPIRDYQMVIKNLYKYNANTKNEILNAYSKLNLVKGNYDSIFIRRGDKLGKESVIIPEENYMDALLEKNPRCKTIYLQTDDYTCYLNLVKYIKQNNLGVVIHTLCDENSVGVVVHGFQKDILNDASINNDANKDYLSSIIQKLNDTKPVEDMNSVEKYKHTMDMIVGIDLVIHSNICITDYQSNVSRFIKLAHDHPKNVYNIDDLNNDIDYDKIICPSYSF